MNNLQARVEWIPNDAWIGVFWRKSTYGARFAGWAYGRQRTDVWICLLPCLPLHLWWYSDVSSTHGGQL